jgi:aryl-alcohol dehydrogenase-like predicted oxidoreductase
MIQQIELGNSGLQAPPLGFGCAALLGRTGKAASLRALEVAWNEGIRFFDTARSYGYGESEALLGSFLKGRRNRAIIATKFGMVAAPQPAWKRFARSAARSLLAVAPGTHSFLRKRAASQFTSGQFDVSVLRASIDQSLQKLGTDYVDILFMHSAPSSVLEKCDLLDAMGRLVQVGKVRLAGLSSDPEVVQLALKHTIEPLRAMQFPCNVFDLSGAMAFAGTNAAGCVLVANHPFGGVARVQQCKAILRRLASDPEMASALREKLENINDLVLADVVFSSILSGTGIHVVIPAMMRVEHVKANVRAVSESRFTIDEVRQIRTALLRTDVACREGAERPA